MSKVLEDMRNESLQEGIQIGKQEGIQIGEKNGLLKAAKRLLDGKTLSLDEIAKSLDLPLEEVKKLQAE